MTDRPIIYSAPMVQATWDGYKNMTRRLAWRLRDVGDNHTRVATTWQKVQPGDRLWVRENFSGPYMWRDHPPKEWGSDLAWYWADGNPEHGEWTKPYPSIHMPRRMSRLTLIVTATKIEPLQAISERDCIAEGCCVDSADGLDVWYIPGAGMKRHYKTGPQCFKWLWESIHGHDAWLNNTEVVAITFRVVKANIDAPEAQAA